MPLEIRELTIKITIEEKLHTGSDRFIPDAEMKRMIVNDCVEMVMSKLDNLTER